MNAISAASSIRVIDASLAVWAVIPVLSPPGISVASRLDQWRQAGVELVAPMHWIAECTTAIRSTVYTHALTVPEGRAALADLLALPIVMYPLTAALCEAAFDWAGRLGQRRAYDAFYLALADELQIEFWTADRRLVNGARQAGMTRARWIGES